VGLAALSPHPQLLQYMLVGSGVFSLWVAFGMGAASPPRAVAVRRLAFALGAVLLGGAISAVQYLPVREYTAFSPRAGGARGYDYNTSFSFPPEELINTLIPEFTGILRDYFGRNGIHLHNEYVGAAVWVLVVAAFRRQVRERQTWLWLGMAILFTLWALGGFTPFYRLIWAIVPGTKYFRAPSTVFFVAQLALAMLAGLGAQGALLRPVSRRFLTIGAVVAVAITLAGASGMLTGLGGAFAGPGRELMVEANATHVMTGTLRAMAFLALTLALLWSVGAGKLRPALASWALVAIIVVDQATVLNRYWLFSEKASVIYAPDATIAHVRQATATEPGRVLALPMGDGLVARDAMLTGSGLMAARVRSVTGYHGNELARYQALVGGEAELANLLDGNPNVQQLLNMRWILSGVPDMSELPFRGGGPRRVAGPARNASGSMVYLHELREPNPFAWVAPVIVKAPDEATLQTILDPRFPVASVALFDTSAAVQGRTDLAAPPPVLTLPVRTTKYEPGAIDLELGAPAPAGSALVVSENFYPGWTATIDGKPAVAHRAMYTLIGVPLEPGARRVSLRFTSATYETGKTVTLVALALALLLLGAGVVLGRRTPTSGVATG
ncbi:MAG: YfhO family protein, partial [Gemmatimonadaceae bacterium]|nr:YfhO family protein [Gemmatimonadaceae bacterium]